MFRLMHKLLHFLTALILASTVLVAPVYASNVAGVIPGEPPTPLTGWDPASPLPSLAAGCDPVYFASQNLAYEQTLVELVNTERNALSLPPLKRVSMLDEAARYHAADMAVDNYFNHDTYDRVNSQLEFICSWSQRISGFYSSWSWLGENIAAGASTPQSAMQLWMDSPGHRANILNPDFWEIGVGMFSGDGSYTHYWVQDFGRRRGLYPLVIDNERQVTEHAQVNLYLYGEWSEMRLHADQEPWSNWMPFQSSFSWNLPLTPGEHTVFAEMRSESQTSSSSDSIYLDIPAQNQLGNLPDTLQFIYSVASQKLLPAAVQLTPLNTGSNTILRWQVTTQDAWIQATPEQGATPQPLEINLLGVELMKPGIITSTLEIEVTTPLDTLDSLQIITVTLQVIDAPLGNIYLPILSRNAH